MRAVARLTLVLVAVLTAGVATAGKIAFLDSERALLTVRELNSRLQALEQWTRQEQARLGQLQDRVDTLTRQLVAQRAVATPEAFDRLDRELLQAQRDLEDAQRDFRREMETRRQKIVSEVRAKISQVAADYGEATGLDAILLSEVPSTVYSAPGLDITEEVIRLYDERFPAS